MLLKPTGISGLAWLVYGVNWRFPFTIAAEIAASTPDPDIFPVGP
jgi:hypothetical protein